MDNFLNLEGKRIIVTGASSGIGRSTAIALSQQGAEVVIIGRREDELLKTFHNLSGNKHVMIVADLTDYNSYNDIFNQATQVGKLDGFVHCAGLAKPVPAKMLSEKLIKETFDINFVSFMELVKHFIKKKNSEKGSIVVVSSQLAYSPHKCMSIYAASKGAVDSAVKSLAYELLDKNYRVNSVVPGPVETPMAMQSTQVYEANIQEGISLGMAQPVDIANAIMFLLSDVSRYVTGRSYFVDGGRLT